MIRILGFDRVSGVSGVRLRSSKNLVRFSGPSGVGILIFGDLDGVLESGSGIRSLHFGGFAATMSLRCCSAINPVHCGRALLFVTCIPHS